MNNYIEEGDFGLISFKPYVDALDAEYQVHVEGMMREAFATLSKAEKLMIRPLIELAHLKLELSLLEPSPRSTERDLKIKEVKSKIASRLHVLNENGDIHVQIKHYNVILMDLYKKRSAKVLAKMGASMILSFVDQLKNSGELHA